MLRYKSVVYLFISSANNDVHLLYAGVCVYQRIKIASHRVSKIAYVYLFLSLPLTFYTYIYMHICIHAYIVMERGRLPLKSIYTCAMVIIIECFLDERIVPLF